jgi:TP901 family phage tail tape measure protein
MATDLGTATGRIIIDSSGARAGVAGAQQSLLGFGKTALKTAGIIGGAAGLAAVISDTIGAAAGFEQQLSSLEAVTNASAATMDKLAEQALRLGESTAFSASEVAGAQTELVKAGTTAEQVLGGALDAALALAAAGEVDLAQAASTVAIALNAFGLEAADAGRVADVLAVTANTTATDINELSMAMQQGSSAAKQAGLPFEDFIGMLGALAEQGVRGSDAGTSLKAALLGVIAPLGRGEKAIAKYGLEFFKSNGEIKGAVGLASELAAKLGHLNPQQRTAALNAIAGRDGFRALAAAYDLGAKALGRNIVASQRQGAAAEAARTKQDNLRGDVEKLSGAIETLQIRAAGAATAGLRVLTQGTTDLIGAATESEDLAAFGSALVELGTGAADAVGALAPLAGAMADVAGATLGIVGNVAGFGGAMLSAASDAGVLQAALIGLAAGYGAVKLASLAAAVSVRAVTAAQTAGAFAQLAGSVRSGADAMSLIGAVAPKLANPMIAAGAAVAVLAGGVALLASGVFAGATAAEAMASAIDRVGAAASGASAAVSTLAGSVDRVKETNLRATETALGVERAQRTLNEAVAAYGPRSLEAREAQARLADAQFRANLATRDQARANQSLTSTSAAAIVKTAELVTQIRRGSSSAQGYFRIAQSFGGALGASAEATDRFARDLVEVDKAGGGASARMNSLRAFLRRASAELDTGTRSGRETKRVLDQLGSLDTAGISRFGRAYNTALAEGKRPAQALKTALDQIKPPKAVKLDAEDKATAKIKKASDKAQAMKDKEIALDADPSGALAGIASVESALARLQPKTVTVTVVKVDKKGSWNTEEMLTHVEAAKDKTITVTAKAKGSGQLQRALELGDISRVVAQREALSAKLAAVEAAEERRQEAAERRRLARALSTAQAELRRAKPGEERASAKRSVADAKAALAEFRVLARVEARRTGLEASIAARDGIIEGIRGGGETLRGAVGDVASRLGEAIDRGLQAKIGALGETLRATMAAIADGPEARRIAAIDLHIGALRSRRETRDAARQAKTLADAEVSAAMLVQRRRDALARARTESERQAAQALLDQALADQALAAEASADFREDQELAALEREKAALDASLAQRREAAQTAHDDAVAAAQAEADARKAALNKQLGDLAEALNAGLINRKQFNRELARITGDPALAADLERSGRELGMSFTRGLSRAIGSAEDAAEGLARAIAKYLRLRSPAAAGPLRHNFKRSGSRLVLDFAAGMLAQRTALERAAGGMAGVVAARSAAAGPATVAGGVVNQTTINVDGPTLHPRTLAAQLAWEAQQAGRR